MAQQRFVLSPRLAGMESFPVKVFVRAPIICVEPEFSSSFRNKIIPVEVNSLCRVPGGSAAKVWFGSKLLAVAAAAGLLCCTYGVLLRGKKSSSS